MATVPTYEIGKVKDSPVSGGFQQIQTNSDAFGAAIAQVKSYLKTFSQDLFRSLISLQTSVTKQQ